MPSPPGTHPLRISIGNVPISRCNRARHRDLNCIRTFPKGITCRHLRYCCSAGASARRSEIDQARVGEVVLFERDGRVFVHRVLERAEADPKGMSVLSLITKGDALDGADAPVSPDDFLGRVIRLNRNRRHIDLESYGQTLRGRLLAWASSYSAVFYRPMRGCNQILKTTRVISRAYLFLIQTTEKHLPTMAKTSENLINLPPEFAKFDGRATKNVAWRQIAPNAVLSFLPAARTCLNFPGIKLRGSYRKGKSHEFIRRTGARIRHIENQSEPSS